MKNNKVNATNKEARYWDNSLDRFGLLFVGIFIGALMELTGIKTLGIIIGVSGVTCIVMLMWFIKLVYLKLK